MGNYIFKSDLQLSDASTSTTTTFTEYISQEVQTVSQDNLEVDNLTVNTIYFKNSQWRMRANTPNKLDFIVFERYNKETKQWDLVHRIIF